MLRRALSSSSLLFSPLVDKVDVLRLQEAGGWSSLAMPRRYVEEAQIANDGMA